MDDLIREKLLKTFINLRKSSLKLPSHNQINLQLSELFAMEQILRKNMDSSNISSLQIQKSLKINKSAVSQMMSSLEQKGYIERKIDENDRRCIVTCLTKQGKSEMEKTKKHVSNSLDEVISRFGEKKTEQLIDLFNEFTEIFDEIRNEKICEATRKDCSQ